MTINKHWLQKLAQDLDTQLNESIEQDISDQIDKAEKNDNVETVTFGLETDDGKIVKAYINSKDADKFEEIMSKALGSTDSIEDALNKAAEDVDIVDVEWPEDEETDEDDDEETIDVTDTDGVLDKNVYSKKNLEKEGSVGIKAKKVIEEIELTENERNGISSRLTTSNQQLVFQALLDLGMPEVALDRSPYKAAIIKGIRDTAFMLQNNASLKTTLRTFVRRRIDLIDSKPAAEPKEKVVENQATDLFWTVFDKLVKAFDPSSDNKLGEAFLGQTLLGQIKQTSSAKLAGKMSPGLRSRLNQLDRVLDSYAASRGDSKPVVEQFDVKASTEIIRSMLKIAETMPGKADRLLGMPAAKRFMTSAIQGARLFTSQVRTKLDQFMTELSNVAISESVADFKEGDKVFHKQRKEWGVFKSYDDRNTATNNNAWVDFDGEELQVSLAQLALNESVLREEVKIEGYELDEAALETIAKGLASRITVTVADVNNKKVIVAPKSTGATVKMAGVTTKTELTQEQVTELIDSFIDAKIAEGQGEDRQGYCVVTKAGKVRTIKPTKEEAQKVVDKIVNWTGSIEYGYADENNTYVKCDCPVSEAEDQDATKLGWYIITKAGNYFEGPFATMDEGEKKASKNKKHLADGYSVKYGKWDKDVETFKEKVVEARI